MNSKAPFVVGLALQKEINTHVAVCRVDGFVSFRAFDYGYAVRQDTDFAPKDLLHRLVDFFKAAKKQEDKRLEGKRYEPYRR